MYNPEWYLQCGLPMTAQSLSQPFFATRNNRYARRLVHDQHVLVDMNQALMCDYFSTAGGLSLLRRRHAAPL
jgi:hypothetical protein